MRAGFGKSDLTPPLGVELTGFGYYLGRCALSVNDLLYARAVMLEYEGTKSLIISCDLLGLSRGICDDVIAHAARYGCASDNVIMVSVHTHCASSVKYHEGCGYVDDDYAATVAGRICRAVDEASQDMCDVTAITNINRPYSGDHIYNRADPDGPVDRILRGFIIARSDKKPIAMVSAACHGVFRGRATCVSADFSGAIDRIIDENGMHGFYINGLCGDIDPYMPDDTRLEEYASLIAKHFLEGGKVLPLTLESGSVPFTLKLMPVTRDDIIGAADNAVADSGGEDAPRAKVARTWEKEMLEKLDSLTDTEPISVKYIILGGVPMMALPFEGFTRIGMDIRAICSREDALILGCAEELLGYLPTKDDISRGSYAALESTFLYKRLPVVPGEAERLGEEMGRALKRLLD